MRRQIAALLIGVLLLPRLVSGQTLAPGTRVRFSHPGEGTRTGTVVALTSDTLEVRLAGRSEPARLPLDQVTRLDVSLGLQRHLMARAGVGFLTGTTLGALGGAIAEAGCGPNDRRFCLNAGGGALVYGLFFGCLGGILGLTAGVIPSETWERFPLERRRLTLVAPSGGNGRGVGLRIAF
jgi:hypothetical protein